MLGRRYGPTGFLHLFFILLGADQSYKIGSHHSVDSSESHGEIAAVIEVLGSGVRPHRYHYLIGIPLSAPSGIHGIGIAISIVGAYYQHRLRCHPWIWFETFHSSIGKYLLTTVLFIRLINTLPQKAN